MPLSIDEAIRFTVSGGVIRPAHQDVVSAKQGERADAPLPSRASSEAEASSLR